MPIFGACPHCEDYRAQRDRALAELSAALDDSRSLVKEVVAFKRNEIGLPPAGFEPLADPASALGPRTRAMIDRMSGGMADLRGILTNFALVESAAAKAQGESDEDVDTMIAAAIERGDAS